MTSKFIEKARFAFVPVAVLTLCSSSQAVRSIAMGDDYTLLVRSDGTLWGTGANTNGQLTDGSEISRTTPTSLWNVKVLSAAAGPSHSLVLRSGGELWGAGSNNHGELAFSGTYGLSIVRVATDVVAASAGRFYTLFIKRDGTLWSVGYNYSGQLGDGTNASRRTPVQIATDVVSVAAGEAHTLFVKTDGSLWAVGDDLDGQLGDGMFASSRSTPVQVASDVAAVAAGRLHTMFVKKDGTLWGMGRNFYGQLGDGSTTDRSRPVQVASDVVFVSGGTAHTMFIKKDGSLWATGRNVSGELGDGTTMTRISPIQVGRGVATVKAGNASTLFVKLDGTVWGMGANNRSQLGDGTFIDRLVPVPALFPADSATNTPPTGIVLSNSSAPVLPEQNAVVGQLSAKDWDSVRFTYALVAGSGDADNAGFEIDGSTLRVHDANALGPGPRSVRIQVDDGNGGIFAATFAIDVYTVLPPSIGAYSWPLWSTPGGAAFISISYVDNRPEPTYIWRLNGRDIPGAKGRELEIDNIQPADTGLYSFTVTNPAGSVEKVVPIGLLALQKVVGAGSEVGSNIYVERNGNTFDQVLLTGASVAVRADYDPDPEKNQITRISFVDLNDDIVQVELSGPGTLSLVLDQATEPLIASKYNQPEIKYIKGHAGIVISGATENTNVSVFAVGRATALNQALFKDAERYDGIADIAFIAITSAKGKFGGVRTANANYFALRGYTGLYAPNVAFTGPVYIGNVDAFDAATPVIQLGSANDVRITGGDLYQDAHVAVQVTGLTQLKFTDGSDAHGNLIPAKANQAVLEQDGVDVTSKLVVGP